MNRDERMLFGGIAARYRLWAGSHQKDAWRMTTESVMDGRQPRLATVLRLVLEHLENGVVVALSPAEQRLAHRLQGALAAFDVSSQVWSEPLVTGDPR